MSEKLEFIIEGKDKFSGAFGKLKSSLPSLKTMAVGAAGGITALSTALFATAKTTATTYDKYQKFSDQTALSTEYLSGMTVAAGYAGISQDSLFKSIKKLTVGVGEAANGVGYAKDVFSELGISTHDATGKLKTAEQLMPVLADKFSVMTDTTKRLEMAQKLFGNRNTEVLQLLNQGSDAMKGYTDRAGKLGMVVKDQAARNAALFNDSMSDSKDVILGLKNSIGEQLIPYITGLSTKFNDFVINNRERIIKFGKSFLKTMANMAEKGAYAIAFLVDAWRGLRMVYTVLKIGMSTMVEAMLIRLSTLTERVVNFISKFNFGGVFDGTLDKINKFNTGMEGVLETMGSTREQWQTNLEDIANEGFALGKVDDFVTKTKEAMEELAEIGTAELERKQETNEIEAEMLIEKLANEEVIKADAEQTRLAAIQQMLQAEEKARFDSDNKLLAAHIKLLSEEQKKDILADKTRLSNLATRLGIIDQMKTKAAEKDKKDNEQRRKDKETAEKLFNKQKQAGEKAMQDAIFGLKEIGGKKGFQLSKNLAIADALMHTYLGAQEAFTALAGIIPYGPVLGAAAAAAAIVAGLSRVSQIKSQTYAAHGGMTDVPKEQTMLLDKGERILSPNQNQDLTDFLNTDEVRGNNIENINIEILPNATNAEALLNMDTEDWLNIVESNIIPAMKTLSGQGIEV